MIVLVDHFQTNGFRQMSEGVEVAHHYVQADPLVVTAQSKNSHHLSQIWVQAKRMSQIYLLNIDHFSIRLVAVIRTTRL